MHLVTVVFIILTLVIDILGVPWEDRDISGFDIASKHNPSLLYIGNKQRSLKYNIYRETPYIKNNEVH